jgi:hypothetical protein
MFFIMSTHIIPQIWTIIGANEFNFIAYRMIIFSINLLVYILISLNIYGVESI